MAHFQVAIRCRPSSEEKAWRVRNDCIELPREETDANTDTPQLSFSFDRVLTEDYSHAQFYETVIAPSIQRLVKRESSNVAVLTYGLPCTGKTHTVFGTSGQTRVKPEARGVIMRCGEQLFRELNETTDTSSRVVATFCHVFESEEGRKSRVADLFDMKKRDLEIVEGSSTQLQFSIPDLTEQTVTNPQDILGLVEKGYLMRNATGCVKEMVRKPMVKFNTAASQPLQQYRPHSSHAIFTLKCEQLQEGRNEVLVSRIIIADLAGRGIEQIHSENTCLDSGIKVLHNVLKALTGEGSPAAAANVLFPQSSLTKLLKPNLGGNCDTILIGNVCLKASSLDSTKKCLHLLSESRRVKNFSKIVKIPVDQSTLRKCLKEGERARTEITQKLGIDTVAKRIEIIGDKGIKIDDSLYEDISSSVLDLAKQVVSTESQIICDGEPMQKLTSSASQRQVPGQPLAMVRPSYPTSATLTTAAAVTAKANQPSTVAKLKVPSPLTKTSVAWTDTNSTAADDKPASPQPQQDAEATSSVSSLSVEGSDSEPDDKVPTTPVIAGPPPPPLRGIPHLNPDTVDISDEPSRPQHAMSPPITTVLPSQSRPIPPRHLAIDGFSGGGHQPKFHPVPLLSTPHSIFQRPLVPQAASIPHGATPATNAHIPLSPVTPSSTTPRKTSLTLQLDTKPAEIHESPSISTSIERPTHLSREPLLVSPGSHTLKSLSPIPSPVAVAPAASVTTPTAPAALQTTERKPPIPPAAQRATSQERLSDQLKAESESREDLSSESSDESLTSDSESMDLQEEARDTFDTGMQPRPLQRLQPMRHNFASLYPVDSGARGEIGGPSQLSVLPPISPGGNRSGVLPPIRTALPPIAPNNPPAYRETSNTPSLSSTGPPNYSSLEMRGREPTSRGEPFNPPDLSQYISNEEIHVAAMEGVSSSQMKSLAIQYGVDFRDHGGRTPLMYTIIGNQPKLCATLVKLKAAVNAQDSTGMSPLLWATFKAKPDIIKILLRNGADIHHVDPAGQSAFHWAMKTPNIECLKLLCKYINSPVMVNQPDNNGLTPLHWAVMSDQPAHLRLFLTSTNADVGVQDRDGRTALNFAVLNFSPSCIQAILDSCESAVNLIDKKGRTALHYACAEGSADCVRTLLTYRSCDLQCADNRGTTPLHWAAAANQSGLIQLLLRRGADRTIRDYDNMLPLDYAEQRGHNECVKLLQNYGHRRPLSAASQVALTPPTTTPTLDEHGHVRLKNPTRRFSLTGESMTSFDHRLPADGQAQSETSVVENAEVENREDGEGEQNQWAYSGELSTSSGGSVPPPQQGPRGQRWIRFLLCGCASQRDNVVAPLS